MKSSCRGLYLDLYNIAWYMAALQLCVHGRGLLTYCWEYVTILHVLSLCSPSLLTFLRSAIKVVNYYKSWNKLCKIIIAGQVLASYPGPLRNASLWPPLFVFPGLGTRLGKFVLSLFIVVYLFHIIYLLDWSWHEWVTLTVGTWLLTPAWVCTHT